MPKEKTKKLVWTPAVPVVHSDNIISSDARASGETCFVPSYENDPLEYMNYLMTNEYMRIWFRERDDSMKEILAKKEAAKEGTGAKLLQRRFVQRYFTKMKVPEKELKIIKLKRFQNIPSKIDNGRSTPSSEPEE